MHYLFNKKTFMGFFGLMLVASLLAFPAGVKNVDAEGENNQAVSVVKQRSLLADTSTVTIFGPNATWKYWDKGTAPASGWLVSSFNDSTWPAGSALLGYGNGGERTVVSYGSDANNKYPVTYFRKVFNVDDPSLITALKMDVVRDDGAVVYLNGKEVGRSNMPSGTISNSTRAGTCLDGTTPVTASIDRSALVKGANTIAVTVHQCTAYSSDLAFSLSLTATVSSGPLPAPPQPTTAPTPTQSPVVSGGYYVTTSGTSSGNGSMTQPWSLAYALSQPSVLKPGDTIWVRGGTYNGQFTSKLQGASSAPITVRAYPGERVILRNGTGPVLDIYATAYVNFWGLEITSTYATRSPTRSESTYGVRTYQSNSSHHIRFINMLVHDVQAQGIGWWEAMTDAEIYGSLFYYNGTTQFDHAIYTTNKTGTHAMINNFIFDNSSHGVHAYVETTTKSLNNIYMEGNTLFNNGSVGYTTTKNAYGIYKRNILIGGTVRTNYATITNNYTYYPGSTGYSLNLGWSAGSYGSRVTNNYFAGGGFVLGGTQSSLTMTGNTVYAPGGLGGFSASSYPNNSWAGSKPTGTKIFVRPNKYEPNRANITIFNWSKQGTVAVAAENLGGISLKAGDRYELHNAQNFYGDVITGVYDGSAISVPMTGHSVVQPVGLNFKPASTFPEFGAFVLIAYTS